MTFLQYVIVGALTAIFGTLVTLLVRAVLHWLRRRYERKATATKAREAVHTLGQFQQALNDATHTEVTQALQFADDVATLHQRYMVNDPWTKTLNALVATCGDKERHDQLMDALHRLNVELDRCLSAREMKPGEQDWKDAVLRGFADANSALNHLRFGLNAYADKLDPPKEKRKRQGPSHFTRMRRFWRFIKRMYRETTESEITPSVLPQHGGGLHNWYNY